MDSSKEEKKEFEIEGDRVEVKDDTADEDGALVDLPKELQSLRNKEYEFLDDLDRDLMELGLEDLNIVIDPKTRKARWKRPSDEHDEVTRMVTYMFNLTYGRNRWGEAGESANVYIQAQPDRPPTKRKPDIAFWGYNKCVFNNRGFLTPRKLSSDVVRNQTPITHPDVVFQFSLGNSFSYEEAAMDDMMNRALVEPHQRSMNDPPKLGFLVKARTKRCSDGPTKLQCLDVYRIPRGATVRDAEANSNGASKASYTPGGQDVVMEITASDLGIKGFWALFCSTPFTISAKDICEMLQMSGLVA